MRGDVDEKENFVRQGKVLHTCDRFYEAHLVTRLNVFPCVIVAFEIQTNDFYWFGSWKREGRKEGIRLNYKGMTFYELLLTVFFSFSRSQ